MANRTPEQQLVDNLEVIADGLENPVLKGDVRKRLLDLVSTPQGMQDVRQASFYLSTPRRLRISGEIPEGQTESQAIPRNDDDDEPSVTLTEQKQA